jgi:hypothetical protein
MSHFLVFALVPDHIKIDGIEDYIDQRMTKYDENRTVDPYIKTCYCVGEKAKNQIHEKLNLHFTGKESTPYINFFRDSFVNPFPGKNEYFEPLLTEEELEIKEKKWQEHLAPVRQKESELFNTDKIQTLLKMASKDCEECKGTGKQQSAYNPDSKWDWFSFAGRWDGFLSDEEEERRTSNGFNFSAENHRVDRNIKPVSEVIKDPKKTPFAFLLPNGDWIQKGRMGMFGLAFDEESNSSWSARASNLMKDYLDHSVVLVDCHI